MVFVHARTHNGSTMHSGKERELVGSAEYLLWVLARCDVESLAGQRGTVLRQLRDLENRAQALDIPDLYREIIESPSFGFHLQG